MIRFAANLSFMFTDAPFLDRFARAAAAGFEAVEYLFPYDFPPEEIAARLKRHGLVQALFNAPPGDWARGDRGIAGVPGREAEFRASLDAVLRYAEATGVDRVHVMAGLAGADPAAGRAVYRENLGHAARRFAEHGLTLLIEPLNPRDMKGYLLLDFDEAVAVLDELGAPNARLQFDIYHRQIVHGDVTTALRALMSRIGHIQIASVPDRAEPDTGELAYADIFRTIDRLGYEGWIGCEYRPAAGTEQGLGWLRTLVPATA